MKAVGGVVRGYGFGPGIVVVTYRVLFFSRFRKRVRTK